MHHALVFSTSSIRPAMVMQHHGLSILPTILPFCTPWTRHVGFVKAMRLNYIASLMTVLRQRICCITTTFKHNAAVPPTSNWTSISFQLIGAANKS
jgi:hypothetical protein